MAYNEPPHLDLHYLPSSLGLNIFGKFANETFVVCILVVKELSIKGLYVDLNGDGVKCLHWDLGLTLAPVWCDQGIKI